LSAGCAAQDFLACEIRGFSKAEFYLHLPEKTYDVLDFLKSKFEINIPTNPPILQRLVQANFSCVLEGMPSIFRVSSLAPNQVLDDLIVDNAFKSSWEANSFTGITFRSV
jgi:hypothetical protein